MKSANFVFAFILFCACNKKPAPMRPKDVIKDVIIYFPPATSGAIFNLNGSYFLGIDSVWWRIPNPDTLKKYLCQ